MPSIGRTASLVPSRENRAPYTCAANGSVSTRSPVAGAHRRTVWSLEADTTAPSGEYPRLYTSSVWPSGSVDQAATGDVPPAGCCGRRRRRRAVAARCHATAWNRRPGRQRHASLPDGDVDHSDVSGVHPTARCRLSGENAASYISPLVPEMVQRTWPVFAAQTCPSAGTRARRRDAHRDSRRSPRLGRPSRAPRSRHRAPGRIDQLQATVVAAADQSPSVRAERHGVRGPSRARPPATRHAPSPLPTSPARRPTRPSPPAPRQARHRGRRRRRRRGAT